MQKMTGWIIILISATKPVPSGLSSTAASGATSPTSDAEDDRDDHREVEVVGPVPRCGPGACLGVGCDIVPPGPRAPVHPTRWSPLSVPDVTAVTVLVVEFARPVSQSAACVRAGTSRWPGRCCCSRCWSCSCSWSSRSALATYDARRDARATATDRAVSVARAVADSPTVTEALGTTDPSATIQPYADRVYRDADVDFVTVMSMDRIRYSHPEPGQHRQGVHRRRRRRARGPRVHPAVHRQPRPVDARRRARVRARTAAAGWSRWSRSASPSPRSTSSCATTWC